LDVEGERKLWEGETTMRTRRMRLNKINNECRETRERKNVGVGGEKPSGGVGCPKLLEKNRI